MSPLRSALTRLRSCHRTDDGRATLAEQRSQWSLITETLSRVWHDLPASDGPDGGAADRNVGPAGPLGLAGT